MRVRLAGRGVETGAARRLTERTGLSCSWSFLPEITHTAIEAQRTVNHWKEQKEVSTSGQRRRILTFRSCPRSLLRDGGPGKGADHCVCRR